MHNYLALIIVLLLNFKHIKSDGISPSAFNAAESSKTATGVSSSEVDFNTLELVQIFFRHGDRSPLADFPKNPVNITEQWPTGMGQLTLKGKSQAYELGQFLRKRYSGFIKNTYHPDDVYAQSSDWDRTIMSGLSVLAGLYSQKNGCAPSINWNPAPIRTIPLSHDNKIAFSANCPNYWSEMNWYKTKGEGKRIDEKHANYYDYIANNTGLTNITFETINDLYDTLFVQHSNGFPLPEWSAKACPGEPPFLMRQIAEISFACLTFSKKAMTLRGGPFFREIMRNIDAHTLKANDDDTDKTFAEPQVTSRPKMHLYSGHDTTVATIMQIFDVYQPYLIPYSSAIMIELHKGYFKGIVNSGKPKLPDFFYIKIFYRNCTAKPPSQLCVPNCSLEIDQYNGKENPCICPIDKLREIKAHLLASNWKQECGKCGDNYNSRNLFDRWVQFCSTFVIYPFERLFLTFKSIWSSILCYMHRFTPCKACESKTK